MAKPSRRKTSRSWIQNGPLTAWMFHYARWLAGHPAAELAKPAGEGARTNYKPTTADRVTMATSFAHRLVDSDRLLILERRKEFRDYFDKLRSDVDFHTRELAKQEVAENFEIRRAGLHKAAGRKVGEDGTVVYDVVDLKAIEHYTRPFVERGIGKKVEHDKDRSPRIVINLIGASEERKKLWLEDTIDEVEYEVIENDKLLTDGDDD
jgi:hypothetical protein